MPTAAQVGADATGTATAAIAAHVAAGDAHPIYTTAAEAAAAAPVQSVSLSAPSGWNASSSNTGGNVVLTLGLPTGFSLPSNTSQANWDTAYAERLRWDGGTAGLVAATGRASLGLAAVAASGAYGDLSGRPILGTAAATDASDYATAAQGFKADSAVQPAALSSYQPLDSDLSSIAALSTTSFGRSLLTQADAAASRTTLGLGSAATATAPEVFTPSADGLAPASGGGTSNFLRADGTWAAPPGGGGGGTKSLAHFTVRDNNPPATNFATLDTRNSVNVLEFDAATEEFATFVDAIPEGTNLASGLLVRILWMGDTATSGNVRWAASLERGNTDLDANSFDTATEVTSAASGTSGILSVAQITCTAIDGLSVGELFRLRIARKAADATNDTMAGDAQLVAVEVRQVA